MGEGEIVGLVRLPEVGVDLTILLFLCLNICYLRGACVSFFSVFGI